MLITTLSEIKRLGRAVEFDCGMVSNRFLLKSDGMGFTMTLTQIPVGDWRHWHYKNHLEACYCIKGKGILCNVKTHQDFLIEPGTLYALDMHDDHEFKALEYTELICVFNPPLVGREKHNSDGSYE